VPFEEKRLLKWRPPYIVQPKLDGDRCRAILKDGTCTLLSSEENPINSVPHITDFLQKVLPNSEIELDGELYTHGMRHEEIHGIASRSINLHSRMEDLEYHVFDLVLSAPQFNRLDLLLNLDEIFTQVPSRPVHIVPYSICKNLDEVLKAYDNFVGSGYEGIIVRNFEAPYVRKRSNMVMKFKPKKSDWYVVCGYSPEVDQYGNIKQELLGRFICAGMETTPRDIGEYPAGKQPPEGFFAVGSSRRGAQGTKFEEQRELWKRRLELYGKLLHVQYQHTTEKGVPRFPVFAEVVWDLTSKPEEL
jgi:ATP-dependent DNA ligase